MKHDALPSPVTAGSLILGDPAALVPNFLYEASPVIKHSKAALPHDCRCHKLKQRMTLVREASIRPVVMVVDDDEDTRIVLSKFLQTEFDVLAVRSAEECLETLKRERVDLVLLDLLMPEMDGLAALREIRRNPAIANTPVIVVTAWENLRALEEAGRLGAKKCLIKPIFRRELLWNVRTHLQPQFGRN